MLISCLAFPFTMLDPTVDEFGEDEYFEDFEEDQGQSNQASHLNLLHIFILVLLIHVFKYGLCKMNCFQLLLPLYSNILATWLHKSIIIIHLDDTLSTPTYPLVLVA
jgi:hypothetical protein